MAGITIPAPTGGWNAVSALSSMPPNDAIRLDNLIPSANDVRSRNGYSGHTTSALTNAHSLVSYPGASPKLLLGANGNIYDITASGAGTDLTSGLAAFANNKWYPNHFKDKVVFCNAADHPLEYDGSTVAQMSLTTDSGESTTNLVSNGTFTTDPGGWTKGTGWTINTGANAAQSDGSQTADSDLTQTITLTEGRVYKVTFTVSGYSAGNVCAVIGETEGTDRSANGTYSEYIVAGSGTDLDIRADLNFVGNVESVAVYATNLSLNDLAGSVTFKGRVIYWQGSGGPAPQSFFYAAAGAYTGTLTEYALNEFTEGGYIVECLRWTRDGGAGMDDHFVVLMSTGEVLVYQGSDPGNANDWSLIGIYKIGRPVGSKPSIGLGGDAVVITTEGYLILSAAIQDARTSEKSEFSFKISNAARTATQGYSDQFGWEACLHSDASLLIFNVPISSTESVQHVRNTTTGAWCRFTGIDATCWCSHEGSLYFAAADGYVYKYGGFSDNGAFIPMRATCAYNYFGDPGRKKQVTAIQVMSNYAYPKYLFSTFWSDYNEKTLPAIADPPEPTVSEWDVGAWDSAQWDVTVLGTNVARKNVHGFGYCLSHTLRLKSRAQQFVWYASHLYMKAGGIV